MAVIYDEESGGLAIVPDECPDCGQPWYDTGCAAPGCLGYCCMDCGTGCDIEFDPDAGRCANAIAEEGDEEAEARVNRERAAFGLSPLTAPIPGEE
jgi:hypothetical protein